MTGYPLIVHAGRYFFLSVPGLLKAGVEKKKGSGIECRANDRWNEPVNLGR